MWPWPFIHPYVHTFWSTYICPFQIKIKMLTIPTRVVCFNSFMNTVHRVIFCYWSYLMKLHDDCSCFLLYFSWHEYPLIRNFWSSIIGGVSNCLSVSVNVRHVTQWRMAAFVLIDRWIIVWNITFSWCFLFVITVLIFITSFYLFRGRFV